MHFFFSLLNNLITLEINCLIVFYTCWRFFVALRYHNKLTKDFQEFNSIVNQARSGLDYISTKVTEVMKGIKDDVDEELSVTGELTKLNTKMAEILGRFSVLEEDVIEFVRMDYKMDNARVETPADIGEEVRKALQKKKMQLGPGESIWDQRKFKYPKNSCKQNISSLKVDKARSLVVPEVRLLQKAEHSNTNTWIIE
ncbi:uncharacterized protein [Prorops nasuta]|uniref:uncharacterized protein n=1 Tax=Prorops nasuta TaxID=863751 RepID=UPI0034CF2836